MRAVIQRVEKAAVTINHKERREISTGLVILLGVGKNDRKEIIPKFAEKIVNLRIFSNPEEKFDYSLLDIKGEILIISQFTLYADCAGGRRPDFTAAARPEIAEEFYQMFINEIKKYSLKVVTGEFASQMLVEIFNDGPVTITLDSDNL